VLDFKRDIDLIAFACDPRYGYERDRKKSSHRFPVLKHPSGDKISISRAADGTWLYYSFRDDRDNGSILDFVMHRDGARSPADACRLIASYHGTHALPRSAPQQPSPPPLRPFDREAFAPLLATTRALSDLSYLVQTRGLNASLVRHRRFASSIGQDADGRTIFFHRDELGICGWEVKSPGWTGFALGGKKTLWSSEEAANDKTLVLAESSIDALSFAQLHPLPHVRYKSFAGDFGRFQLDLITAAAATLPVDGKVILAVDNDAGGDRFAMRLTSALAECRRAVVRCSPRDHKDWNDALKARCQSRQVSSMPRSTIDGAPVGPAISRDGDEGASDGRRASLRRCRG